jgi:DNA invertase Pin-like site-specific DNA recombinase
MLALVKSRQVERILVKDLSRLGRNYIETGRFIDLEFPCLCQ